MLIAMELGTSISVVQNLLTQLGDVVENNGDGSWRIVKVVTSEVVSLDDRELTKEEAKELFRLEKTVEKGFYLAGVALTQIREQRLYRKTHSSFEKYCRDRFDFTRAAARYLIGAAEVVNNLKCKQFVYTFPTKESQCRPLLGLTPELQRKVWLEAVKQASGKVPSARIVKSILEKSQGKMLNQQSSSKKSTNSKREYKEGLNYEAGLGCEWNVKVEQSTYERLNDYQIKNSFPTLNSAIVSLLESVDRR
jgi:hypothetical protein